MKKEELERFGKASEILRNIEIKNGDVSKIEWSIVKVKDLRVTDIYQARVDSDIAIEALTQQLKREKDNIHKLELEFEKL